MTARSLPYIYVTGAAFSGSTLLAFLLNSHPDITTVSETGGPMKKIDPVIYPCSCGAMMLECPFFTKLEARINALGSSFSLRDWKMEFELSKHRILDIPLVRPLQSDFLEAIRDRVVPHLPGYRSAIREIAQRNLAFARAALEVTGKRIFADAQKDSIRVKFLRDIEELDLFVIHLVRDARAGTVSFMRNENIADAATAARKWLRSNRNSERAAKYVSPDRWLTVRYEELSADPQQLLDRICDFTGARRVTVPDDIYAAEHHVIGNRMRLRRDRAIRPDESWKEALDERALRTIARIAGRANRRFGFDWP